MKKIFLSTLVITALLATAFGQPSTVSKPKIALFSPLCLDSAFDHNLNYRYSKYEFPDFIIPGLEFYEGAQLALDSLQKDGTQLEVYVYDSRSTKQTLQQQLSKAASNNVQLIIAYSDNGAELRKFAEAGRQYNIPVINANLPNDGAVKNNPNYIMLNSTLKTQCEGMYRFIQKNYATQPIVVFRKKGQVEDAIKKIFTDFGSNTVAIPLKLKYVDLPDSFTVKHLKPYLDSTQKTLCVAGSLNDPFGKRLITQIAQLNKKFPTTLMGMPTWNLFKDFTKSEYSGLEVLYCTPFYNSRTDKTSQYLLNYFTQKMFSRPSDMVMLGFETTWKFAKMLEKHRADFAANITVKEFNIFRDFDIQPVIQPQTNTLDYFENKKLYFLKWLNGTVTVK